MTSRLRWTHLRRRRYSSGKIVSGDLALLVFFVDLLIDTIDAQRVKRSISYSGAFWMRRSDDLHDHGRL
jgi:hypothetical protein